MSGSGSGRRDWDTDADEAELDDGPIYKRTPISGGYELVEDGILCIIEPDPVEEQLNHYLAEQDREAEAYANDPCSFNGHEWTDAGGGLEICGVCMQEVWTG